MNMEFWCSNSGLAALSCLTRLQVLYLFHLHLPRDQLEIVGQQHGPFGHSGAGIVAVHPLCFQQLTQLTSLSFDPTLCGRAAISTVQLPAEAAGSDPL